MTLKTTEGPVPTSSAVSDLEERFVMTAHLNRLLLKKLRQVKLESYFSSRAKILADQLLSGKPALSPIAGVDPLTAEEMDGAAEMINGHFLMRQTMNHGKELYEASKKGDIKNVRRLLSSRPTSATTPLGGSVSEASSQYLSQVVSGNPFKQLDAPAIDYFPMAPGAIHVIAAPPGVGKSALSECIGLELAHKGEGVLDVTAEMPVIPKFARYVQHVAGPDVGMKALVKGAVSTGALAEATRVINSLTNLKMLAGTANLWDIKDAIRHHHEVSGVKVVIIDYLQLIQVPGITNNYEKLEVVLSELKALGDELGLTQFWLSQFNKSSRANGARPTADGLEGSGRIEQLAWTIAILEATGPLAGTGTIGYNVHFDKSRFGGKGALKARLNGPYYDFYFEGQKPLMERVAGTSPLALI